MLKDMIEDASVVVINLFFIPLSERWLICCLLSDCDGFNLAE